MRLALSACALALVVSAAAPASAQDGAVTVFPPLFREMARETRAVRPASELTVTPQPVAARPRETVEQRVAEVR
ncbi:hypothetical protein [Methylobacterium sp. ID0610]|uniref:hypothetical protein n=1 Tax=Methylobacterium carpenticola TaxID=3344827 RepID=UPI003695484F